MSTSSPHKPWSNWRRSSWWIRWSRWEYWPMQLVNIPVGFIWLYYAIRARHPFFFSNTNPVIENGGFLGESKENIFRHMPDEFLPKTILVPASALTPEKVLEHAAGLGITYPFILKPNIGERGFRVERIDDQTALENYLNQKPYVDVLLQEYVDYPVELSVMYHRSPHAHAGQVTSVCIKEMLSVTGDGRRTLRELILDYPRAKLQWEVMEKRWQDSLTFVLPDGEKKTLMPIGNHCRGAMFLNGNDLIDEQLCATFDRVSQASQGIFYGRFDLRCENIESLKAGRNFKILEYNGVSAEPAHIYHPGYSLWQAYRDIAYHWKIIYKISRQQKQQGVHPMPVREGWHQVRKYFAYKKWANQIS